MESLTTSGYTLGSTERKFTRPTMALIHCATMGASARGHLHPALWVNIGRTADYVGNKRMLDEDCDDSCVANIPDVMGG